MAFHQYNTFEYSTSQYNADANTYLQACAETITSSDGRIGAPTKVLADTVTSTDAIAKSVVKDTFTESILSVDLLTKQVSNKGLSETVRVNDWVELNRQHDSTSWSS